jgi:hypothetical protein
MGTAVVKCIMMKTGFEFLVIPIGSFQVFKRLDGTIGIQVVTRQTELAGAIADRAKGYISILATVNGVTETLGTAKVTRIRTDEGPMSRSITIQAAG